MEKFGKFSKDRSVALLCALSIFVGWCAPNAFAAPKQLEPVLKAIDPSQAKMDTPIPAPQTQNPNPLGRINGQPVSRGNQLNRGDVNPQGSEQQDGSGYKYTPYESPDYSNSPPQFPSDSQIPEFGKRLDETDVSSKRSSSGHQIQTSSRSDPGRNSEKVLPEQKERSDRLGLNQKKV